MKLISQRKNSIDESLSESQRVWLFLYSYSDKAGIYIRLLGLRSPTWPHSDSDKYETERLPRSCG